MFLQQKFSCCEMILLFFTVILTYSLLISLLVYIFFVGLYGWATQVNKTFFGGWMILTIGLCFSVWNEKCLSSIFHCFLICSLLLYLPSSSFLVFLLSSSSFFVSFFYYMFLLLPHFHLFSPSSQPSFSFFLLPSLSFYFFFWFLLLAILPYFSIFFFFLFLLSSS